MKNKEHQPVCRTTPNQATSVTLTSSRQHMLYPLPESASSPPPPSHAIPNAQRPALKSSSLLLRTPPFPLSSVSHTTQQALTHFSISTLPAPLLSSSPHFPSHSNKKSIYHGRQLVSLQEKTQRNSAETRKPPKEPGYYYQREKRTKEFI